MTEKQQIQQNPRDYQDRLNKVLNRGHTMMTKIPDLAAKVQRQKHHVDWVDQAEVDSRIQKRRYTLAQACEMIGVDPKVLTRAEQDSLLPPPDYRQDTPNKMRAGYTINQINHIREYFGTAPRKPASMPCPVIGFMNFKGGSTKTTTCHLYSQYLAMQGYRVLVVDTDPQASLSFFFGKMPDYSVHYEHTIAPFLLEDEDTLILAGHPEGASETLDYAVQKTYWSNIDIIPSCSKLLSIDLLSKSFIGLTDAPHASLFTKLRDGLMGLSDDYDYILLDGTPSLNLNTLNSILACDLVFVPTPPSMPDFSSTLYFVRLFYDALEMLSKDSTGHNVPVLRFFIAKKERGDHDEFMCNVIKSVFSVSDGDVLESSSPSTREIGKTTSYTYTIYEENPSESTNRTGLKRACEDFNQLFDEMLAVVSQFCFSDISHRPPSIDISLDPNISTENQQSPESRIVEDAAHV